MDTVGIYRQIIRDTLHSAISDADALATMTVLHTHSLVVSPDVATDVRPDRDGQVVLSPLTRNHVAELVAECFPDGSPRGDMSYWLAAYERETPYEVWDDIPDEKRNVMRAARGRLSRHTLVVEAIPD